MKTLGTRNIRDILPPSNLNQAVVLASSVGQAFDVPTGAGYVGFAFNVDFFVKYGSTAALNLTTTTSAGSSTPEMNPTIRNIGSTASCTGISIISRSTGEGTLSWYAAG